MTKSLENMLADIPKRFEASYIPEPNSGCWIWLGTIDKAGYGRFTIGRRGTHRTTGAHIISYILEHKTQPPSELDHKCRMRCCVNPDHLEPVTRYENIMRGNGFGAVNARKTHCVHGHEFTSKNTYVWKGRMRTCRTCNARRQKKRIN